MKHNKDHIYDLKVQSIRKYFKTQMITLGVQSGYVDYMMGHTVDTYHDIQSLGVEKLRSIYASASLSIKPKTKTSKIDLIKEYIRALGVNPEAILTREALTQPARTYIIPEDQENYQTQNPQTSPKRNTKTRTIRRKTRRKQYIFSSRTVSSGNPAILELNKYCFPLTSLFYNLKSNQLRGSYGLNFHIYRA